MAARTSPLISAAMHSSQRQSPEWARRTSSIFRARVRVFIAASFPPQFVAPPLPIGSMENAFCTILFRCALFRKGGPVRHCTPACADLERRWAAASASEDELDEEHCKDF